MGRITDRQALALWELGAARHPLDRSLLLLAGVDPTSGGDGADPADLDVQHRDHALLSALAQTVGPTLDLHGPCDGCGRVLEFGVSTTDLLDFAPDPARDVEVAGWRVRFRLPTSTDLAGAVAGDVDVGDACVVDVHPPEGVTPGPLPAEVSTAVEEAMAAAAPHADLAFRTTCEDCDAVTELAFDPGAVLWGEVAARGRTLVAEVVTLAAAFGWSESEVLALGPRRRRTYLDAVG